MKKLVLVMLVVLLVMISGCSMNMILEGSEITKFDATIKLVKRGEGVQDIFYTNYDRLIENTKKRAELEMWSEPKLDELEQMINSKNRYGIIILSIGGFTIASANLDNFTYIICDMDGKELRRIRGQYNLPYYSYNQYGYSWFNSSIIHVPEDIGNFKLYVINDLAGKRSEFEIYPTKK